MDSHEKGAATSRTCRKPAAWLTLSKAARRNIRAAAALADELKMHSFKAAGIVWTLRHQDSQPTKIPKPKSPGESALPYLIRRGYLGSSSLLLKTAHFKLGSTFPGPNKLVGSTKSIGGSEMLTVSLLCKIPDPPLHGRGTARALSWHAIVSTALQTLWLSLQPLSPPLVDVS